MLHQEDTLVKCPYNPSHLIRPKRMQTHLVKCRKTNNTHDYVYCPLDATHHLPREELEMHVRTCSKRIVVESSLYKRSDSKPVVPNLTPEAVDALLPECSESWDDDCAPTYNPMEQTAGRNVMRILKGATPSEKKAFQQQERRRLLEIQDRREREGPVRTSGIREPMSNGSGGIRLPMQPSKAFLRAQHQSQKYEGRNKIMF